MLYTDTVNDAIIQIADVLRDNIRISEEKQKANIAKCYKELQIVEEISNTIQPNSNDVFSVLYEAENDLLNSIVFACQGFYRNAFMCLRSSIELMFSFIYYYDRNYEYILWKSDCINTQWSTVTDIEKGVYNKKFYKIIWGREINLSGFIGKVTDAYHKCSQSVHGKYGYMQTVTYSSIKYDDTSFYNYIKQFEEITEIIKIILYLRFKQELDNELDQDELNQLDILIRKYEV
ncbi:MAG: hypothetical protein ACI4I6_06715 [Hominimerdicola sp.]